MTELSYEEIYPRKELKRFVKRFWKVKNLTSDVKKSTVLPDGYFDLILKIENDKLVEVLITGIYSKEFDVETPPQTAFIGISFLPLAAEYIFQHSVSNYLNLHETMLSSFWGLDQIDFVSFEDWTSHISEKLLNKSERLHVDSRKQELFNILFETKGTLSVQEVSKALFWNGRQINRYFNGYLGLTLKAYMNILRCKATYNNLKNGNVSSGDNFADQAHFIKQIKKHTGNTPKILAKNKNDRFVQFSTRPT